MEKDSKLVGNGVDGTSVVGSGGSVGGAWVDTVDVFLRRQNSKQEAALLLSSVRSVPPETATVESLRYLATSLAWGSVLEASGAMLHGDAPLDEQTRLEVMTFRVAGFIQTRQIDRAAELVDLLSDDFRTYFLEGRESDPGVDSAPPKVQLPFELKALSADITSRKGSVKAFEIFYDLKSVVRKQLDLHRKR